MVVVKIEGQTDWKCFRAKGGNWIGVCNPLGLTIQSKTWANLLEDIAHTLNAMFVDLLKSRELEKFLSRRGWRPVGRIPSKATDLWFDVPFVPRPSARGSQVAVH